MAAAVVASADRAERVLAEQVRKDTAPFVPALTGSLTERTMVIGNSIVYPGPYARYLYYGKLMVNPKTGSAYAPLGTTKVLTDRSLVFTTTVHGQAQAYWFEASRAENTEKWARIAEREVKKLD